MFQHFVEMFGIRVESVMHFELGIVLGGVMTHFQTRLEDVVAVMNFFFFTLSDFTKDSQAVFRLGVFLTHGGVSI